MNKIDLAVLAAVGLFGLLGFLSGASRQLAHWAALALAAAAAPRAAAALEASATPLSGWPPALAHAALETGSFAAISIAGGFLLALALRRMIGAFSGGRADRGFGFLLGAAKGAVGAFAVLAALLAFEKPLTAKLGREPAVATGSAAVAFVRAHNPLADSAPPALAKLRGLLDQARDPKTSAALASDPEFKALLNDPALKSLLGNKALADALKSGDFSALRKNLGAR